MNENEVMTPELAAEIDAAWDDETPDSQPEETKPDTPEITAAEPGPEKPPAGDHPDQEAPSETPPADQPELFTLKNRDETRQVGREELIAMAQKGWDYDAVRQERDQLRAYRDEADPAMSLVKAFAQRSGMTVSDYLDYCRKQELMSAGVNEATARAQVNLEKQQAAFNAQQEQQRQEQAAQQRQQDEVARRAETRRAEMKLFMDTYPDVRADSIPQDVWAMVHSGMPLTTAYAVHRGRTLEAELAAERQNRTNREKSTGSMSTAGEQTRDVYDEGWYDDD